MITVTGDLIVRRMRRNGRYINTGVLICRLGTFQVNYSHMAYLDEGEYSGFFSIIQFQVCSNEDDGKFCFEMEANVQEMAFKHAPIASEKPDSLCKQSAESQSLSFRDCLVQEHLNLDVADNESDALLFDTLWPLSDEVQLDMTQSRDRIRMQSKRLQQLAYRLNSKKQVWIKTDSINT